MLRVGLTGGLAAGKSAVAEMFAKRGARVLHADRLAHELMQPGMPVYLEVVKRFGANIVKPDGTIDRTRLAEKAFAGRIEELNRIVHPAVISAQEKWMADVGAREPLAVAMVEAALIIEAGVDKGFDKIVVVTCADDEARVQRYATRTGKTLAEARGEVARRMAAQMPEAEKAKRADYVIDNCGSLEETEQQVGKVFSQLKEYAEQVPSGAKARQI